MAIQVIIKRKIKQGLLANELVPIILQMRARAMFQPGYISGETLCEIKQPGECIVISRWETVEDWEKWAHCSERKKLEEKIEALTGEKTEYHVFSPMVPHGIAEKVNRKQSECITNAGEIPN